MMGLELGLVAGAFLAGLLMFLAPCTLPLIPAYLAFISGIKEQDAHDPLRARAVRRAVLINGCSFIIGFSVVFVAFGMLAGFFGTVAGSIRSVLVPLGGVFIIVFGLVMLDVLHLPFLKKEHHLRLPRLLQPGHPAASALIGAFFALGWSPCIGPVLATILFLASFKATVLSGGLLLFIFSLGLAIPFLLTALAFSAATRYIARLTQVSVALNAIGGLVLVIIGGLLLTDSYGFVVEIGYRIFEVLGLSSFFELL